MTVSKSFSTQPTKVEVFVTNGIRLLLVRSTVEDLSYGKR